MAMQQRQQPAYVEAWDALEFPGLDVHTSSVDVPLFHQRVALVRGIAEPGTPDAGEEVWIVVKGQPLVAKAFVECAQGDNDHVSDLKRWIAAARQVESAQKDWQRGREQELASRPDIAAALDKSPEQLYDRAGLTDAQRVAMRLFCQVNEAGEYKGYGQIAAELRIGKDSARDRVEAAIDKILAIGR